MVSPIKSKQLAGLFQHSSKLFSRAGICAISASVPPTGSPLRTEQVVRFENVLLHGGGGVVVVGVVVVILAVVDVVTGFMPSTPLSPKHSDPSGALESHDVGT